MTNVITTITCKGSTAPDALMQCINPYKDEWAVRWGVTPTEEGYMWREAWVHPKPTPQWVGEYAYNDLKAEELRCVDEGIEWQGYRVCLDAENQHNYFMQSIFILLFGLPIVSTPYYMLKDGVSVPHTFASADDLKAWLRICFGFVVATKAKYIALRNAVKLTDYEV